VHLRGQREEVHDFAEDAQTVSGIAAGGGELFQATQFCFHRRPPPAVLPLLVVVVVFCSSYG
jgi:hypothetical protein